MSKATSLLKNTAILSIGKLATQMISFFLLPLYTALLSTTDYGIVDLLQTLTNLIVPVISLQIDQGLFRFLIDSRQDKARQQALLSTSFCASVGASLFLLVCYFIAGNWIHSPYAPYLAANLIIALFMAQALSILRGLGKNLEYSIASFITGASTVIFNLLFVAGFHMQAYGMLLASILANTLAFVYILTAGRLLFLIRPKAFSWTLLQELLAYSIPLVPNVISWWIVSASDRLLISGFLSLAANGIYAAANKFPSILTMLFGIFNLSWAESASSTIHQKDASEFFSKVYTAVFQLCTTVCILASVSMCIVYPLLINARYSAGYDQVFILLAGAFFNMLVSFLGSVYIALKKTRQIAATSIAAAIINLVINLACIHWMGLYAASLSTLAAYFVLFIYRFKDVQAYISIHAGTALYVQSLALAILAGIFYYLPWLWVQLAGAAFLCVLLLLYNRSLLLQMWKGSLQLKKYLKKTR